mgnify:CR=1 FL=1
MLFVVVIFAGIKLWLDASLRGALELRDRGLAHPVLVAPLERLQALCERRLVRIGVSIGASQFPEHGDQVGTLVALADAAMARSKRGGRNRWSMAIPDTPVLKSVPVEAPPAETPPPEGAGSVRPVLAAVRNPLSES